jgi:hypothetical protein
MEAIADFQLQSKEAKAILDARAARDGKFRLRLADILNAIKETND